jgi:hypothetical protein
MGFLLAGERFQRRLDRRFATSDVPTIASSIDCAGPGYKVIRRRGLICHIHNMARSRRHFHDRQGRRSQTVPLPLYVMPGLDPGIHHSSKESCEGDGLPGRSPAMTNWGYHLQIRRKIPAFPCHFAPLGLEPRHVRSPRTPGGLLWMVNGPRCGL